MKIMKKSLLALALLSLTANVLPRGGGFGTGVAVGALTTGAVVAASNRDCGYYDDRYHRGYRHGYNGYDGGYGYDGYDGGYGYDGYDGYDGAIYTTGGSRGGSRHNRSGRGISKSSSPASHTTSSGRSTTRSKGR